MSYSYSKNHTSAHDTFYKRILLSPSFVIIVIGGVSLFLNFALYENAWTPSHTVYTLGIIAFLIGYFYFKALLLIFGQPLFCKRRVKVFRAPSSTILLYWIFVCIGGLIASYVYVTRGLLQPDTLMFNLRYAHTIAKLPTYGARHFAVFALALAVYYIHLGHLKATLAAVVLFLYVELAFAERTGMLLCVVGVSYVGFWYGYLKIRHLLITGFVFIMFTVLIAISSKKIVISGEFFLLPYLSYGLSAFNTWYLDNAWSSCISLITGSVVQFVFDAFGHRCISELGQIPNGQFNVATYALEPYLVAGNTGVMVTMALIGIFYSVLHWMAQRKSGYFVAILGFLMYAIVMVFYAWQFTITTYIYLGAALLPLFFYPARVSTAIAPQLKRISPNTQAVFQE